MSVLLLVFLLLLIVVNGFFVAAEFAIVRSRRSRLEQLREEGDKRATQALNQVDHVDQYVATSQVGITLASLGIGFLGEPALAALLEPLLGEFFSHAVAVGVSIAIAFTIVTFLHVILGEQAPKMLAIGKAEGVLMWIAGPMAFFRRILHPLIVATNVPANFLVHLCRRRRRRGDLAARNCAADLARRPARPPRPRRGGNARRRLPPPRAGGAGGDDPDPGGHHRRHRGHG